MNAKTNILVADDDAGVRRAYARSLSGTHCEVREAPDGVQALRAMEQEPFDVVLLDLRMPGLDGMAVLATIKRRWPASEVVVITGYPSLETAKAAMQLGAYDYMPKPVGPDEVIHAANGAARQKRWALHIEISDREGAGNGRQDIAVPHNPN
jgi:DNA-binding NtrC family response regulator